MRKINDIDIVKSEGIGVVVENRRGVSAKDIIEFKKRRYDLATDEV